MVLTLKSATTKETKEVAWSNEVVDYLVRHGAIRDKDNINFVYIVHDIHYVYSELCRAKLI